MSLMEQFADPTYFEGLTLSEKLTGATVTMCMGLGITFIVLFVLWGCIAVMAKITHRPVKNEETVTAVPAASPAKSAEDELTAVLTAASIAAAEDNGELVAVIAAAVAAMENTVVSNLVVRKITRVSGPTNAWASAGLSECIDSRRM